MSFTLNSLLLKSNMYTYEYFQQSDICRLCWKKNAFKDLASKTNEVNGLEIELMDILQDCLDLDLCIANFPTKVCDHCWEFVKKFYYFKSFCKEADRKLRDIITPGALPVITVKEEVPDTLTLKEEETEESKPTDHSEQFRRPKIRRHRRNPPAPKPKFKPKSLPNYCYRCFNGFQDAEAFAEHSSSYHGIVDGLFKCFGCNKLFKSSKLRSSHETKVCRGLKEGYKCPLCGGYLANRKLYESHIRLHSQKTDMLEVPENIFKCGQCDESFKCKDTLRQHMSVGHPQRKNYVCELCGVGFMRQDYLRKHIMIHTGVKRNVCPHCGLRFTQKSSLNVHLRTHTGERPYSCDVCPQRCISSSNLRAHRRRHQGLKHFECAICGRRFGYKLSLAEHIVCMHAPTEKHECRVCGASYTRWKVLRRHLTLKHPDVADIRGVKGRGETVPVSEGVGHAVSVAGPVMASF